ncbi:hypothetical protein A1O1_02601 [Capronia coronata CBS 617.96]|uniref:beta-glucosidase n=1 Tax=Capronia coronata CBS 617.96 TaxID=1182541 RepID=W9YNR7_9EURO|nr:uncharacterized protein A1O1_02601 [Capronia coronata CBS 617.96]EXJ94208.1 hypothetical protein A1O1_02601 [Capronia coronata CBS 617.96]
MPSQGNPSRDVEHLLSLLTLEEKVSLLAGADEWQTQGIERLGVGVVKTTDGPAGARGKLMVDGPRAAFLPAPVLQAATWSKADLKWIGQLLCKEAKTKGAQVLLAPTMCGIRNPLGGRNFESFSEDPFLSGSLAIEYVAGLQETGEVQATAKHFVANEQEFERFSIDAIIEEKALREIYLRPFEMLVKSSTPPGCIMTAYNCVNGVHMDMNTRIVQGILRDEWKFDGLVMSDWGGTNSTIESVIAGCDLEMPGPGVRRGQKLLDALKSNKSADLPAAVDECCKRVLTLAKRMNLLGLSEAEVKASRRRPEISATTAADLQSLRKIVSYGHVLLKNSSGTLPLSPNTLQRKKVAFVGPNSKTCTAGGGGSASMNPQYQSHPLDAFKATTAKLGLDVEVHYAMGAYSNKWLPLTSSDQWSAQSSQQGQSMFKLEFFANADFGGPVVDTQYRNNSSIDLTDSGPASLREVAKPYSVRATSYLRPTASGKHNLSITSVGDSRLFVDGKLLIDNYNWTERGEAFYAFSSVEVSAAMEMTAGQTYNIVIETASRMSGEVDRDNPVHVWSMQPSVRVGYLEELPRDMVSEALTLANRCDYTIVAIGLTDEWESEGYDRQTMSLPGNQDQLVQTLLEQANRPESIIVVNQSGSPVEMPWAEQAPTILQAWYGGQEAGNALADVLLGLTSPSGHLPISWPRRYADLHFSNHAEVWPGVGGRVVYSEGTNVGYRWYLNEGVDPQWWFGHGLGYTSFTTSVVEVINHPQDQGWDIVVDVHNTGSFDGQQVVQVYSWPEQDPKAKELRAFEKTGSLRPGTKQRVTICVKMRDMAHWIEGQWVLEAGKYLLGLGEHAGAVDVVAAVDYVPQTTVWGV